MSESRIEANTDSSIKNSNDDDTRRVRLQFRSLGVGAIRLCCASKTPVKMLIKYVKDVDYIPVMMIPTT